MTTGEARPRILVVGSYVEAFTMQVPRMPGAGETVIGWGSERGPGGKGSNQAIQAARLGAEVEILARIGADALGEGARRLWREEGLGCDLVRSVADLPTGVGYIILDGAGQNRIVVDPGANARLGADEARAAEPAIAASRLVLAQLEPPVEGGGGGVPDRQAAWCHDAAQSGAGALAETRALASDRRADPESQRGQGVDRASRGGVQRGQGGIGAPKPGHRHRGHHPGGRGGVDRGRRRW
jgi:hypothetical protein